MKYLENKYNFVVYKIKNNSYGVPRYVIPLAEFTSLKEREFLEKEGKSYLLDFPKETINRGKRFGKSYKSKDFGGAAIVTQYAGEIPEKVIELRGDDPKIVEALAFAENIFSTFSRLVAKFTYDCPEILKDSKHIKKQKKLVEDLYNYSREFNKSVSKEMYNKIINDK